MSNDLNSRIAIAKGWQRTPIVWIDPDGHIAFRPDYVGTLEGVAELMRDLNERAGKNHQSWEWGYNGDFTTERTFWYHCQRRDAEYKPLSAFVSRANWPTHCIAEAWLSVFEKEETADADTE